MDKPPSPAAQNRVWPEWLAEDVEGLAVWSVGYEAPVSNWRGSAMDLADRAANGLSLLQVEPSEFGNLNDRLNRLPMPTQKFRSCGRLRRKH